MNDLVFGVRLLRTQPAYAALTIVTIAIGIAVSTTLFSVANGVLLAPLPFADADRLVGVSSRDWISFAAGPALLLIAGVLACAVPARRVARTDPIQVLRES